jgi:ABC-type phosphate/phosphonate transport system permease subunit
MTEPAAVSTAIPSDPFRRDVWPRIAAVALVLYVIYACSQLDVSWERVQTGLQNAARFFARLFPPNFKRCDLLTKGCRKASRSPFSHRRWGSSSPCP